MILELMVDAPKDEHLVRSALAGDQAAFGRLFERYSPPMFRMIRAQVGDASLAEDLVQDTFLNAFVALPKFQFGARFFTWLYRIMVNTVGQHHRKIVRRRELDARVHQVSAPAKGADALVEIREDSEKLWRALAELPEEYRTVLLLREWGELTYAEIAEILECPVGTVDSRIARARKMLLERLAPK